MKSKTNQRNKNQQYPDKMGSISEQIRRIEAIEAALRGGLNSTIVIAGADLCADIADRVINTGKGADGAAFSAYSEKKVPAFWYAGRSLNASGEAKIKAAQKKKEGVSYREFREFNNRPGSPKNFSFSNEMWRGFGVKEVAFNGSSYTLTIGGKNKDSSDKMGWMEGQEGRSIIAPNKAEIGRLLKTLIKQIER